MTPLILAPWFLTLTTAATGFIASLRQKRTLVMPKNYLAFFAVVGSIQLVCFLIRPGEYHILFWVSEIVHNILLCVVSVEIIYELLPRRYAITWILAALLILSVRLVLGMPAPATEALLNLSITASFTSGVLLILLLFIKVDWKREHALVTAGVIALLLGDVIPWIGWLKEVLGTGFVTTVQLGPLTGLVLMSIAGFKKRSSGSVDSPI